MTVPLRPAIPEALDDRAAKIAEPLLALAALCGISQEEADRMARAWFAGREAETLELGEKLLSDLYTIFTTGKEEKLTTVDLAGRLCAFAEAPWERRLGVVVDAEDARRLR